MPAAVSYLALGVSATADEDSNGRTLEVSEENVEPQACLGEPYLYEIPPAMSITYRAIPFWAKIGIGVCSAAVSAVSISLGDKGKTVQAMAREASSFWKLRSLKFAEFLARTVLAVVVSTILVQDTFRSPSRIATTKLRRKYWLPSSLSKFSTVHPILPPDAASVNGGSLNLEPINVHYLWYDAQPSASSSPHVSTVAGRKFDVAYFNHGFGASSLSWLPAIPKLVDRLGGKVGIAHDAMGFGFTDRVDAPGGGKKVLVPYSLAASAAIGSALLEKAMEDVNVSSTTAQAAARSSDVGRVFNNTDCSSQPTVALFGHSMGSVATLRMALALPQNARRFIVLVSPALLGKMPLPSVPPVSAAAAAAGVRNKVEEVVHAQPRLYMGWVDFFVSSLRRVVLDAPLKYILRRVVAGKNFWRNGLRLAWGDPDCLTRSDVLRFQWPSVGLGWEKGLLCFTRARIAGSCDYPGGDLHLLRDVLALPNTSVTIISGGGDSVVPISTMEKLVLQFPQIRLVELDGLGHDPFEEQVDIFIDAVAKVLVEDTVVFA